jgi:hypothetical protein
MTIIDSIAQALRRFDGPDLDAEWRAEAAECETHPALMRCADQWIERV